GLDVGVAVELERVERTHFVTAAAAVSRPGPFPLRRLAIACVAPLLFRRAAGGLLRAEVREIIPVFVVLAGVRLTKIPAFATVRRLGRWPVADFAAALAIAQTHPRRGPALVAVRAPARESPIVRSLLSSHQ